MKKRLLFLVSTFVELLWLTPTSLFAGSLPFKVDLVHQQSGMTYSLAILGLVAGLWLLTRKKHANAIKQSNCLIINQKTLNHQTTLYVIAYRKQTFFLIDNQQSIVFHALKDLV